MKNIQASQKKVVHNLTTLLKGKRTCAHFILAGLISILLAACSTEPPPVNQKPHC